MSYITEPVNKNAQKEVRNVLRYLGSIAGKKIILGQHTQTMNQEELKFIKKTTGKMPALCGFELLGYSPNINYEDSSEECLKEVYEAKNTLEKAWEWAGKKGIITLTWHWFSPLNGRDKAFYSENTDFDAAKAAEKGTKEYEALIHDMDVVAELLKPFCEKHIPILWRPFHECDGDFFWWGKKGPDVVKKLYRIMYERYTEYHKLNNLIWVFNSPVKECFPGDDVVDMISRDLYPPAHTHTACEKEFYELKSITDEKKLCAIGEIGPLPDVETIIERGLDWTYFMTWSNDFARSYDFTKKEVWQKAYSHPDAVTLDKLPILY